MLRRKISPHLLNEGQSAKPRHFFYRLVSSQRFLAIIGLIFLLLIIFPLARSYSQKRLVEKEIEGVQKQIAAFESQNQNLKDMVSYLQSDQSLEEQARLNLNLKKPGEQVVVIEAPKGNAGTAPAMTTATGNFSKWWRYFFP